jgi:Flp pilus assembly protein TadG
VTATVNRVGGLTVPISITPSNLPSGVTAAMGTIAAGSNSGTVTLTAPPNAALAAVATGTAPAAQNVTIDLAAVCTPACPGITGAGTVSVRLGRRLGQFAVAAPSLRNAPASATSADNAIGLDYTVANPQPPGTTLFTATYRRVGSSTSLAAINLAQSAISWGAGFCAASPTIAGVVLSGTYGGVTNAPMFYELPIWAPTPGTTTTSRTVNQPLYAVNSSANTTITPTLWFSPDCTIAAFVQSSFAPSPPAGLTILDMTNGQPIGGAMLYTGASPSRLEVVNAGGGQQVQVQFTPADVRTVPIP